MNPNSEAYQAYKSLFSEYIKESLQIERKIFELRKGPIPSIQQMVKPQCHPSFKFQNILQRSWDQDIELLQSKFMQLLINSKYKELQLLEQNFSKQVQAIEHKLESQLSISCSHMLPFQREKEVLKHINVFYGAIYKAKQQVKQELLSEIEELDQLRAQTAQQFTQ